MELHIDLASETSDLTTMLSDSKGNGSSLGVASLTLSMLYTIYLGLTFSFRVYLKISERNFCVLSEIKAVSFHH
jgi:hypothetical protein